MTVKIQNVLDRYTCCIVTGQKFNDILQVCRIIPHHSCIDTKKWKSDIDNSIILTSDMQKLFNKYHFSINPTTKCVELGKSIINNDEFSLHHGKKIKIINKETLFFLKIHYDVFKKMEINDKIEKTLDTIKEMNIESIAKITNNNNP